MEFFFPLPLAIVIATALFGAYLTPTWLAMGSRIASWPAVAVFNLTFGWTILGFVLCLAYVADRAHKNDTARRAVAPRVDEREEDVEVTPEPTPALAA